MSRILITFRSITPAQRAQRLLSQTGISAPIQRTPRILEQAGCGYCLRLTPEQFQEGLEVLRRAGIPFRKAYTEESGQMQELVL